MRNRHGAVSLFHSPPVLFLSSPFLPLARGYRQKQKQKQKQTKKKKTRKKKKEEEEEEEEEVAVEEERKAVFSVISKDGP
jgi:flagellar biosynthesis component FlhA